MLCGRALCSPPWTRGRPRRRQDLRRRPCAANPPRPPSWSQRCAEPPGPPTCAARPPGDPRPQRSRRPPAHACLEARLPGPRRWLTQLPHSASPCLLKPGTRSGALLSRRSQLLRSVCCPRPHWLCGPPGATAAASPRSPQVALQLLDLAQPTAPEPAGQPHRPPLGEPASQTRIDGNPMVRYRCFRLVC